VSLPKPVLLAGGLTPANVRAIVEEFQPFGVDVARGVESAPGVKDHALVREFIHNAKQDLT
jgi:phosphoribosylanthranilate isomerase